MIGFIDFNKILNNKFKPFFLFPLIFLLSGIYDPIVSSDLSKETKEVSKINPDYLDYLPESEYIISSGDTLNIYVSDEYPELNTKAAVDGEGTIYMPILGRIYVDNLSVNELTSLIDKALLDHIKYPSVVISMAGYRPVRIYIEGEVDSPGLYSLPGALNLKTVELDPFEKKLSPNSLVPLPSKMPQTTDSSAYYFPTVFDAIQKAGGITRFSDLSNIKVIRKNIISDGAGQKIATLNFREVFESGKNTQNIRIYDSDIIRIEKTTKPNDDILKKAVMSNLNSKFVNVFVVGRVKKPGTIVMPRMGSLNDAIDFTGSKVFKGKIKFIRFNGDGSIDKRLFAYRRRSERGSYNNPLLKNGDFIIVGESLLSTTSDMISEISSPFRGLVSTYGLIKAIQN